jgi:hypothetical protein
LKGARQHRRGRAERARFAHNGFAPGQSRRGVWREKSERCFSLDIAIAVNA